MLVLLNQLAIVFALALLVAAHARLVKGAFASLPDFGNARHGLERRLDKVAVVAHGYVATLREGEGRVDGHFLAVRAAEGFGPRELARVALHFEVLVAFGFAEAEGFGVVADCAGISYRIFLYRYTSKMTLGAGVPNVMPLDGYTGEEQK
jgi:hypothetical protein